MDKRTITLKIADHSYAVTIDAAEESQARECAEFLTEEIERQHLTNGRPFDEVLIFFALNALRQNQKLQQKLADCKEEAAELSGQIREYLNRNAE